MARWRKADIDDAEARALQELVDISHSLITGVELGGQAPGEERQEGQLQEPPGKEEQAASPAAAAAEEVGAEWDWDDAAWAAWHEYQRKEEEERRNQEENDRSIEESRRMWNLQEESGGMSQEGEWYVVTIATYVNVYPSPDDKSTPVLGRKCRNDLVNVFEWDESRTWRRCRTQYEEGEGPLYGWVKVITWKYGPLMVPAQHSQKINQLCQGDSSGVLRAVLEDMTEDTVQRRVPEMLDEKRVSRLNHLRTAHRVTTPGPDVALRVDDGRLVLGARPRPPPKTVFRQALVMGAHHTCTTALTRELEAQFVVKVENNYDTVLPDSRPENHKHRVLSHPPDPQGALVICLVKEPCFWLQSLTRHAATYAIHALQTAPDGSYEDVDQRHVGSVDDRPQAELLDAILRPVEFFGDIYPHGGSLQLWEASVRSYFDESVLPLWRTAVVRCEDFLFSFDAVMEALEKAGLERRPAPPPPNGARAKGGAVHAKARDRNGALHWYSQEAHRHVGLEPRHVQAVSACLGPKLLEPLGYGEDAVHSWSSRPLRLFVAGSWGKYKPVLMSWNGRGFVHSLRFSREDQETFQLLLDGSWDSVLYPSVPDADAGTDYQILGPDSSGHGKNWSIRRQDGVRPGDRCDISVQVDASGMPTSVWWEVLGRSGDAAART